MANQTIYKLYIGTQMYMYLIYILIVSLISTSTCTFVCVCMYRGYYESLRV